MLIKNSFLMGLALCCAVTVTADAAVSVKKAAPVATQKTTAMDSTSNLLGTALGLVQTVQSINQKNKELTEACIPNQSEVTFVNDMIKEWAKTGSMSAEEAVRIGLRSRSCKSMSTTYASQAEMIALSDVGDDATCVDTFSTDADKGTIWEDYPKAGLTTYCPDGSSSCSKGKKTVSNIYEVFNLIDFVPDRDYTTSEMQRVAKLVDKIENCAGGKMSKKKKQMWSEFLLGTVGNVGTKYNTSNVMESVGSLLQSGGGLGGLSGLGGIATQYLAK